MELSENFVITGSTSVINTNFFHPVTINEGFQLALTGFSSGSICNVTTQNNLIYIVWGEQEAALPMPPAYYHTIGLLLTAIKESVNSFIKSEWKINREVTLKYSVRSNVWTLTMASGISITMCNHDYSNALNLLEMEDGNYQTISVLDSKLLEDAQPAFLYCSIVQESYINSRQSRLLDVIPLKINRKYNFYEPHSLKFRKIAIEEFNNISFEIRDSDGKLIEFHSPGGTCRFHGVTHTHQPRPVVLNLQIKRKGI